MRKEEKEIEQDQETVNRHLKSIMELKNQIDHLKTEPIIFQANKCEYCGEELNFPSIHCLCNHSFHAEYEIKVPKLNVTVIKFSVLSL